MKDITALVKRREIYDKHPTIGLMGFKREKAGEPPPEAFKTWSAEEREAYFAGAMQAIEKGKKIAQGE